MRIEEELTEQRNVATGFERRSSWQMLATSKQLPSNEGDMMQVEQMEREFTYNGVRLPDLP